MEPRSTRGKGYMKLMRIYFFILLIGISFITISCESTIDIVVLNNYFTNISQKTSNIIQVYNKLTPEKNVKKFGQLADFLNNEAYRFFNFIEITKFSESEKQLKTEIVSKYILQLKLFLKTLDEAKKNYQEPVQNYGRENRKIWNNKVNKINNRINSFIKVHNQLLITVKKSYLAEK